MNTDIINTKIKLFEKNITKYIPSFKKEFSYIDYMLSYKCKPESNSGSRDISISLNHNILYVNCCKITGIYELHKYIIQNTEIELDIIL